MVPLDTHNLVPGHVRVRAMLRHRSHVRTPNHEKGWEFKPRASDHALIPLKENQLCYLGFKNSVVSTNQSRINFKNLISHNPSSHEEFLLLRIHFSFKHIANNTSTCINKNLGILSCGILTISQCLIQTTNNLLQWIAFGSTLESILSHPNVWPLA